VLNALFGYAIYILEREAQPDLFDIWGSMFVAMQVLLTGWATDTYDELNPVTFAGKIVCIGATVAGLFLIAYMIGRSRPFHAAAATPSPPLPCPSAAPSG
jgi:hypothetical protein